MSFSLDVKKELADQMPGARHCRLAEMKAIYDGLEGRMVHGRVLLKANPARARGKFFTLLEKTYNIEAGDTAGEGAQRARGSIAEVVRAIKDTPVKNSCCRRSYLRGMFLCSGSVTDPSKAYQLEYVLKDDALSSKVLLFLREEGFSAKYTLRNNRPVVYLRDGEEISELLGLMGAGVSLLKMENERVLRDVRGNINRRVNLEAANITKAADAASRQTGAIEFLEDIGILKELPETLREIAGLRLENPEVTLEELGGMLKPPIGKSGVNHRLRRLMETAIENGYEKGGRML